MMRAMWEGSISFGLVNIPVKLYNGSEDHGLSLTLLHKKDHAPIYYARICSAEDKEVPYSEIVKGYEYEKGKYVVLDDKDFEKANVRSTHTIDILQFTDEQEIDIRYFQKPYYLEPHKIAVKSYTLLREALKQSKKVAIATCVLRNREHLAVIKAIDSALVLNFIRFSNEVRDIDALEIPKQEPLNASELKMAVTLINQLSGSFKLESYHDTYIEELNEVIRNKAAGKQIQPKGEMLKTTVTKDLMSALKASLQKTKKAAQASAKRKAKKIPIKTRQRKTA